MFTCVIKLYQNQMIISIVYLLVNSNTMDEWIFPFLALNDRWILTIFILSLVGLLFSIILSFIFIRLSLRRLNGHFLLTNLFICFSVCFLYLIIILFLLRANELFCGLREFLSQLAYALLFSAILSRYIMQWLGSRILSNRTKQFTSLLIYFLLIFIQIPIAILWWYFTIPRRCQQDTTSMNIVSSSSNLPRFQFQLPQVSVSSSCSNRCLVDYRFYATFTYTIVELFCCTMIATCLFCCRHCHRRQFEKDSNESNSSNGNNIRLTLFNMFALILIDLVWLTWTCIYYFTHPFYIYPALILGMLLIATISLFFLLLPQVYYYSKLKINETPVYKSNPVIRPSSTPDLPGATTLYSNQLANNDETNDQQLLLEEKSNRQKRKEQTLSNGSDGSFDGGASDTYLPITRTPKGPFKVKTNEKISANEKLDQLIYGEQTTNPSNVKTTTKNNDMKIPSDTPLPRSSSAQVAPLQRQVKHCIEMIESNFHVVILVNIE